MTELDRHSRAFEAELITDPELKAQKEASNGLRQFDAVDSELTHSSLCLYPLEIKLDPPFHRWQWANGASFVLSCALRPPGIPAVRNKNHSRANFRRQNTLLPCTGSSRQRFQGE